ncbi:MAG: endolytic transglycosylase MltG [Chloroflexi bacterium]|nr:endolytic transglycosylase MltG [Chloroflexota bacterium]
MSQDSRSRRSATSNERLTTGGLLLRLGMLLGVVALLVTAALLLLASFNRRGSQTNLALDLAPNPALNPLESAALGLYIANNQDLIYTAVDETGQDVTFTVSPGESASQIAANLFDAGLISDESAFRNYLRYYGLDRELEAGTYRLSPSMTLAEIALALVEAVPVELTVQIPEGWRREQIADYIDQQPDLPFSGADFLIATGPGAVPPEETSLGSVIPPGAALEGFLFPDTYRLPLDATASDLVSRMLINFDQQLTSQMRADAATRGLSLYQVVVMASIVEREAIVREEGPSIASVYLNRLEVGMLLQADPTVQYAQGYQESTGQWWNLNLTQADYTAVISPYNTYLNGGLPPSPIANPGIQAIQSVIYSADTPYFFFRAACDGSGLHNFAVTFEEHLANACQ